MPNDDKLPEPFAPTGPRLSRFAIRPAPPVRPRLFADEARFALRLALLAGGTELAAWAWLAALVASAGHSRRMSLALVALGLCALRALRPLWALLGTRVSRIGLAFSVLSLALVADGAALLSLPRGAFPGGVAVVAALCAALAAFGDLAASCAADAVTIERRAAAFSFLEMGQALGAAAGLALCASSPRLAPAVAGAGLFLAGLGVPDLRDRGTPRSAWPLALYAQVFRTPLARELCALAFATGGLAALAAPSAPASSLLAPLVGMAFAARAEPRAPNAVLLPRLLALAALLAALCAVLAPLAPRVLPLVATQLGLFALGAALSALPAAVARAAGEMERPLTSALVWTALSLGVAASLSVRLL